MTFEIHSFEGALPLRFGVSPEEIESVAGTPRVRDRNWKKNLRFSYDTFNVGFTPDDRHADHFGFSRGASVTFRGLDFFADRAAWQFLLPLSTDYHECLGFLVFCDLGIAIGGLHDDYEDELAVTAFPRGAWDKFRSDFKAFELTRNA